MENFMRNYIENAEDFFYETKPTLAKQGLRRNETESCLPMDYA
jgi:hypothetical protein